MNENKLNAVIERIEQWKENARNNRQASAGMTTMYHTGAYDTLADVLDLIKTAKES